MEAHAGLVQGQWRCPSRLGRTAANKRESGPPWVPWRASIPPIVSGGGGRTRAGDDAGVRQGSGFRPHQPPDLTGAGVAGAVTGAVVILVPSALPVSL
jgi:hypothetical protein